MLGRQENAMAKAKKTAGKKGTKKSESKKAEATLSVDAVKQATKRKELTPLERIKALNSFSPTQRPSLPRPLLPALDTR
jgi:hypothetical protein